MTKRYAFKTPKAPTPERVPRIARLLALAHKFQGMLDRGEVKSMAELARLGRVSRARITQVMDLLMLAPGIQEQLLNLLVTDPRWEPITLRDLLALCRTPMWDRQRHEWRASSYWLRPPAESQDKLRASWQANTPAASAPEGAK